MRRVAVDSDAARSIGYDPDTSTLEVEFTAGAVYRYLDVPEHVHRELMSAPSLGGYLNARVRDAYRFVCVRRGD